MRNKIIAAATVAASMAVGGLAGTVLGTPVIAGAAESATSAVGWVQEALTGLVDDGTITQEQADAVDTALDEARPERGIGHHGFGRHLDLTAVSEILGLTEDEVRTALEGGQTIADVAAAEGVDVQVVIDAVVAAQQARVDEAVAAGDLTQERADELLADGVERATALVNGELGDLRGGRGGFGGRHGGPGAADGPAPDGHLRPRRAGRPG